MRKMVNQMIQARLEHKRIVSTTSSIDWLTAGVVSLISTDVAQGDDITQRSGDAIRPIKLTFRIVTNCNITGSMVNRVILFQDNMANGSTPAVTDVLNSANSLSPYKPTTRAENRFKILRDFFVTSVNTATNEKVEMSKNVPLKGVIHYVGTAAAAASAGRNSLYALFISDTQGTAGQKTYVWSYELEYIDA
jgi:hypothetical protein